MTFESSRIALYSYELPSFAALVVFGLLSLEDPVKPCLVVAFLRLCTPQVVPNQRSLLLGQGALEICPLSALWLWALRGNFSVKYPFYWTQLLWAVIRALWRN